MFKQGKTVLVTRDWEDNNTRGKLGIILNIDGSCYKIGFLMSLRKLMETPRFIKRDMVQ